MAIFAPLLATADRRLRRTSRGACSRPRRSTGSAPTSLAATSCRASSTARGITLTIVVLVVDHRRARRPAGRHRRGLSRRLGRYRADAHHRHLPRLPAADPGARLRRRRSAPASRTRSSPSRSPPGRPTRASRAPRPDHRATATSSAPRGCRALRPGAILLRHIVPLCLSSVIVRADARHGRHHPDRGRPRLPRPRRAAADAGMGRDGLVAAAMSSSTSGGSRPFPGLAIFIVSLGFNLLGDGLRDVLDPKSQMSANRCSPSRTCASPSRAVPARSDAVRGVSLHARPREARHRRRIRARASRLTGPRHPAASCRRPARSPRSTWPSRAPTSCAASERDCASIRGAPHLDGDAGPEILAQPGDDRRPADRREPTGCTSVRARPRRAAATLDMLEAVQIRDPERVYDLYPHELSGGMGQRVMIAMMLVAEPTS